MSTQGPPLPQPPTLPSEEFVDLSGLWRRETSRVSGVGVVPRGLELTRTDPDGKTKSGVVTVGL